MSNRVLVRREGGPKRGYNEAIDLGPDLDLMFPEDNFGPNPASSRPPDQNGTMPIYAASMPILGGS